MTRPVSKTPAKGTEKQANSQKKADAVMPQSRAFTAWYSRMFERLKQGTGPVYVGDGARPFPQNRDFKPDAPLPDAFKEQLFSLWASDPAKWTPRELSNHFKVSIERAMAIVKLKNEQRRLENSGFVINRKYVERMENHLGCSPPNVPEASSRVLRDVTARMAPVHIVVGRDDEVTPSKAAKILGRPLVALSKNVNEALADAPYDPNPPADHNVEELKAKLFIQRDEDGSSRWRHLIVDIGSRNTRAPFDVYVREADGTLRRAMPVEQRLAAKAASKDILTPEMMRKQGILPRKKL